MTKLLVATLPKSGTHFLNVLLPQLGFNRHICELGQITTGLIDADPERAQASVQELLAIVDAMPDGAFVLDHVPYNKTLADELAKRDVRVIIMVRNVYDFVVSLSHHLRRDPGPKTPTDFSLHRLQHWICTEPGPEVDGVPAPPLAKRYARRIGSWTADKHAFVLRFEDIIGPRGGGLFSDQIATILSLRDYLGLDLDNGALARALFNSFRPGIALFRRGQIGSWRDEMAPNTAEVIRVAYARTLQDWGYSETGELLRHANERTGIVDEVDHAVLGLVEDLVHLQAKARRLTEQLGEGDSAEPASDEDGD